jgi:hypothetical protein
MKTLLEDVIQAINQKNASSLHELMQAATKSPEVKQYLTKSFASEEWDKLSVEIKEVILNTTNIVGLIFQVWKNLPQDQMRNFEINLSKMPPTLRQVQINKLSATLIMTEFYTKSTDFLQILYKFEPDAMSEKLDELKMEYEDEVVDFLIRTVQDPHFKQSLITELCAFGASDLAATEDKLKLYKTLLECSTNEITPNTFTPLRNPKLLQQMEDFIKTVLYPSFITFKKEKAFDKLLDVTGWNMFEESITFLLQQSPSKANRILDFCIRKFQAPITNTLNNLLTNHEELKKTAVSNSSFMVNFLYNLSKEDVQRRLQVPELWQLIKEKISELENTDYSADSLERVLAPLLTFEQIIELRATQKFSEKFSNIKKIITHLSQQELQRILSDSNIWKILKPDEISILGKKCLQLCTIEQIEKHLKTPEFKTFTLSSGLIDLLNLPNKVEILNQIWREFQGALIEHLNEQDDERLVELCLQNLSVQHMTELLREPMLKKHFITLNSVCMLNSSNKMEILDIIWREFKQSIIECMNKRGDAVNIVQQCLQQLSEEQITDLFKNNHFRDIALSTDCENVFRIDFDIQDFLQSIRSDIVDSTLGQRELASHTESSMVAPSQENNRMIYKLMEHYKISAPEACIEDMKALLKERYEKSPAIMGGIVLPFDWDSFQQLSLNEEQKQQALKLYYQNENHSAARYFMVPNPWLASDACFINRGLWCAEFSPFIDRIALFYTAATDIQSSPTMGFTLEGRLDFFITEIAKINRAHNWDEFRQRQRGSVTFIEQYDDLTGDKPSCPGGVMSRLCQSVMGHELTRIPDKALFNQELIEMAREHFESLITTENVSRIWEAYHVICTCGSFDTHQSHLEQDLKSLNIPAEKVNGFIERMKQKYGEEFTDNLQRFIRNKLNLSFHDCHAIFLGGETDLEHILSSKQQKLSSIEQSFFKTESPDKDSPKPPKSFDP